MSNKLTEQAMAALEDEVSSFETTPAKIVDFFGMTPDMNFEDLCAMTGDWSDRYGECRDDIRPLIIAVCRYLDEQA